MKKIVMFTAFLLSYAGMFAQSYGETESKKPSLVQKHNAQEASAFVRYLYDAANVKQLQSQVAAWQMVTSLESNNANYWLNYYMVSRLYHLQTNKGDITPAAQKQLGGIAFQLDTAVAGSYVSSYEKSVVSYFEADSYTQALTFLKSAELLKPESKLMLPELALYYNYINAPEERNRIAAKIPELNANSGIRKYSEELAGTLPDNSIIITNGDYDTYAIWLAAETLKKDITAISLKMLGTDVYNNTVCKRAQLNPASNLKDLLKNNAGKPLFVALTVDAAQLKELSASLYNTGFCYQYSATPIDNTFTLYKNLVENKPFASLPSTGKEVLKNLMPGYITLYRQYKESDATKAQKALETAKDLAQRAGFWKQYEPYFK